MMIMRLRDLIFLIGLVLILFSSVSAVSSDNFTDDLSIPDGYHIANESDGFVRLESDKYHSISISVVDVDRDVLKYLLGRSMYDFTYVESYSKGGYDIEENWYNYEYQRGILYICEKGDEMIVIDYKVPVTESLEDSPVGLILDGLN